MILLLVFAPLTGRAADVTLSWDANPESNIAAYIVRYGATSGVYDRTLTATTQTSLTITGLTPGTYYCTISARNLDGIESLPSDELMFDVLVDTPPLVGLSTGSSVNMIPINLQTSSFGPNINRLEFYQGGVKLGEISSASESTIWRPSQAGDYNLVVKAYDSLGLVATSTLQIHVVQPRVANLQRTTENAMEFTVFGAPGRMQHVFVSEDLQQWVPFASSVNSTGAMLIHDDEAAGKPKRFYRVVSE